MKKITFLILFFTCFLNMQAQEKPETIDFYKEIKNYDLSVLINPDSIFYDLEQMGKRDEPLGFIGENYQRFHIHFISVIQNPKNHYEYFCYGKTKVNKNICEFIGTMKVTSAKVYKSSDLWYDNIDKTGNVVFEVNLFEDKKQNSTGYFSGNLTSEFLINKNNKIMYNAAEMVADGFNNNQFKGTWTSYKTGKARKCNFGDYRVPDSWELDTGAGLFMVLEKYQKNGWESYVKCNHTSCPDIECLKIQCKEEWAEWWK